MIRTALSLQRLATMSIIDHADIVTLLNPEEDWDNNVSHLFNERFNYEEMWEFEARLLEGKETLSQIKRDMSYQLTPLGFGPCSSADDFVVRRTPGPQPEAVLD